MSNLFGFGCIIAAIGVILLILYAMVIISNYRNSFDEGTVKFIWCIITIGLIIIGISLTFKI